MNVKEMLELGKECGLKTVGEAYSNVMNHWDAFFTYANHEEEIHVFITELKEANLLVPEGMVHEDEYFSFGHTTIEEALQSINATPYVKSGRGY